MALIALFAPMARSTNRSTTYYGRWPIPTTWLLIRELGCGDGVHDVGPDLFLRCHGSFWHGLVGHPRVKLAAGDPLSARRTCRHSTPLASIGPPHTATAGFPRTQAGGMHHGRSV
jgi:hypothetical protein